MNEKTFAIYANTNQQSSSLASTDSEVRDGIE